MNHASQVAWKCFLGILKQRRPREMTAYPLNLTKALVICWYISHCSLRRNLRKRTFWHVRPTKTQISLRIHAVWSVFVVRMKKLYHLGYLNAPSEDSDQTARMRKLNWTFTGRTGPNPASTWRLYNVASTPMQLHNVASTLRRRCIDVMCPLGSIFSDVMAPLIL